MWDMINAMRLVQLEADPIYGLGTMTAITTTILVELGLDAVG